MMRNFYLLTSIAAIVGLLFSVSPVFADSLLSATPSTGDITDSVSYVYTGFPFSGKTLNIYTPGNVTHQAVPYANSPFSMSSIGYSDYGTYNIVLTQAGACNAVPTADACYASFGAARVSYIAVAPIPPVPQGLFDSSVIMASVVASVQESGSLLWPLFVFVGILIAFYIAEKVGSFIRASVMTKHNERKYYEEEYTPQQRRRIVDKIKELGDRDSFDE